MRAWPGVRPGKSIALLSVCLLGLNVLGWVLVLLAAPHYPVIVGLAVLAYGLGLRHAVDPDHIAAIDNTTRKLVQEGKRPAAVGFFFSLGHSTVVVILSVLVALAAGMVHRAMPALQSAGSVIGTSASVLFLLLIGLVNAVALRQTLVAWRRVTRGEGHAGPALDAAYGGGLLTRLFRPLFRVVSASWQMYPVGFLFGLGFDTATEVALLGLSATSSTRGMPLWIILVLPLLFTAGMSVVDTADGVLMLHAYGWARLHPARKLYYNLTITMTSVVVAFFIGGMEGLQVIQQQTGRHGGLWDVSRALQINSLGFYIIGAFLASWLLSGAIYRLRRYDRIDIVSAE